MKLFNMITIAIATLVATLATALASVSSMGCVWIGLEEPTIPKSLIK